MAGVLLLSLRRLADPPDSLSLSLLDLLLLPDVPPALLFFGGGAREMQPWQYHLPRGTFSSGGI